MRLLKGSIGALDGSHIQIPEGCPNPEAFRCRKGYCSQTYLMACDFDMLFKYVFAGSEGSLYDTKVLSLVRTVGNFKVPEDCFLFGDAAYALKEDVITPYRGYTYHLADQRGYSMNKEEVYNRVHAHLRNVLERTFGTYKRMLAIFRGVPEYALRLQ